MDGYLTAGHQEYVLQDEVSPGDSATAHIWFLTPERYAGTMWAGKVIPVQEGSRLVGLAVISKVLNPVLARSG
jgi:hypothetical protein